MLSTAAELGVGVTAYGELAGLLLPRSSTMTVHLVLNTIQEIAARTGVTVSQVAIAWTLARDSKVVPLVEGRYGSRLTDVLAATRLRMSLDDLARIDAALGKDTDIAPPRPKQAPERSHGRKAELEALVAALTGREMDVLLLLTKGMTNRAVGRQLGIAERTVRDHVAGVLLKLRVKSRVEAAVVATKWDLGRLRLQILPANSRPRRRLVIAARWFACLEGGADRRRRVTAAKRLDAGCVLGS